MPRLGRDEWSWLHHVSTLSECLAVGARTGRALTYAGAHADAVTPLEVSTPCRHHAGAQGPGGEGKS
jgi:hypothetical protein